MWLFDACGVASLLHMHRKAILLIQITCQPPPDTPPPSTGRLRPAGNRAREMIPHPGVVPGLGLLKPSQTLRQLARKPGQKRRQGENQPAFPQNPGDQATRPG